MLLIQPAELSGKIMTLIDQCQGKMVIVSPYLKVQYWKKLANRISRSQLRGVVYEWYYRAGEDYTREFRTLKVTGTPVEKLHCKLYYNESHALITSMNLHQYSDTYSIDIGYLTETPEEYAEILKFVDCHVKPAAIPVVASKPALYQETSSAKSNVKSSSKQKGSLIQMRSPSLLGNLQLISRVANDYLLDLVKQGVIKSSQLVQRGPNIMVTDYCSGIDLTVDVRSSYDRILLQPNGVWRIKREQYDLLTSDLTQLEEVVGTSIRKGDQMKRLKWELDGTSRKVINQCLDETYRRSIVDSLCIAFGPLKSVITGVLERRHQ